MPHHVRNIVKNIHTLTQSEGLLNILMDYERVLAEMGIYAFLNWKSGELVAGPLVGRYNVSCTFMWNRNAMPDPRGAERLLKFGVRSYWQQGQLEYPVAVRSADDFQQGTKVPRLARRDVWLVQLILPKHLIRNIKLNTQDLLSQLDLEQLGVDYDVQNQDLDLNLRKVQQAVQQEQQASSGQDFAGGGF